MSFYRIVCALLGYPDAALRDALPEIATAVSAADLGAEERAVLDHFIIRLAQTAQTAAEEDYVCTFDMVPEHSLHLTHHLIGADKNRGPALIDLTEFYKEYGIKITGNELPDYLPLMLEFASLLDLEEGRLFLSRWNKVLRQLCANLAESGSPYAELVGLVEARSRLVEAAGDTVPTVAAPRTVPFSEEGDFDPPVSWTAPTAVPCTL